MGINIEPLTKDIGAEISGIDLSEPLSPEDYRGIRQALLDHLVIFFRDQRLTPGQHMQLGAAFGPLHIHPSAPCVDDTPELMKIHADADSPFADGTTWHTDMSCDLEPPMGSLLHLTEVPDIGGDTLFASMYAAYDALSETMRGILDPLDAVHSYDTNVGRYEQIGGAKRAEYQRNIHPVVRTHPETGRKCLFVNKPFTNSIVGLSKAESDALLNFLFEHCANPQFQCRFRWQHNSLAFWDNRCVHHHATWDYYPQTRSGIRVTVKGDRPYR
ncbi:MAG: TauD/TfdA family dioxygenase [Gammaproteobacteria bacterium]|nr:TauD/TfdA family dioxygenase [Gammaproteobacteria bacterium]